MVPGSSLALYLVSWELYMALSGTGYTGTGYHGTGYTGTGYTGTLAPVPVYTALDPVYTALALYTAIYPDTAMYPDPSWP